jgi:hypothetical protein
MDRKDREAVTQSVTPCTSPAQHRACATSCEVMLFPPTNHQVERFELVPYPT